MLMEKGSALIGCQRLAGLPSFLRLTACNPATTHQDLDFLLDEIDSLAQLL